MSSLQRQGGNLFEQGGCDQLFTATATKIGIHGCKVNGLSSDGPPYGFQRYRVDGAGP